VLFIYLTRKILDNFSINLRIPYFYETQNFITEFTKIIYAPQREQVISVHTPTHPFFILHESLVRERSRCSPSQLTLEPCPIGIHSTGAFYFTLKFRPSRQQNRRGYPMARSMLAVLWVPSHCASWKLRHERTHIR
jgi:ribonuclease I